MPSCSSSGLRVLRAVLVQAKKEKAACVLAARLGGSEWCGRCGEGEASRGNDMVQPLGSSNGPPSSLSLRTP